MTEFLCVLVAVLIAYPCLLVAVLLWAANDPTMFPELSPAERHARESAFLSQFVTPSGGAEYRSGVALNNAGGDIHHPCSFFDRCEAYIARKVMW